MPSKQVLELITQPVMLTLSGPLSFPIVGSWWSSVPELALVLHTFDQLSSLFTKILWQQSSLVIGKLD